MYNLLFTIVLTPVWYCLINTYISFTNMEILSCNLIIYSMNTYSNDVYRQIMLSISSNTFFIYHNRKRRLNCTLFMVCYFWHWYLLALLQKIFMIFYNYILLFKTRLEKKVFACYVFQVRISTTFIANSKRPVYIKIITEISKRVSN